MSYSSAGHEFFCAAPVASIATESLWATMDHPVKGRSMVECDLPVTWLRKCLCSVVFCHGGQDVRELAKINDYYGFCQSVADSVVKALEHCRTYGITGGSSATIEVRLTVQDEPALFSDSERARDVRAKNCADPTRPHQAWWLEFPFDKFRSRVAAESNPEQPGKLNWRYPYLEARPVAERVIWTSRELLDAGGPENDTAMATILMAVLRREFLPSAVLPATQACA